MKYDIQYGAKPDMQSNTQADERGGMKPMIIDTHAHYDDEAFDDDRERVLESLEPGGIYRFVNIGASLESSQASLALAKSHEYIYAAVGIHPEHAQEMTEAELECLRRMSTEPEVVAWGEIGLDYHYEAPSRNIQKDCFARQLEAAREMKLPIAVHSRDAAQDTLDIMTANRAGEIGGVVHCYSYGVELAKKYLDMGMYFGIGGVITFKNARKLAEVVEYLPMDAIVLETDCPYMAPAPYRGKRNNSTLLQYVVQRIAQIKNIPQEDVMRITGINAYKLYPKLGECPWT